MYMQVIEKEQHIIQTQKEHNRTCTCTVRYDILYIPFEGCNQLGI